MTLGGTGHLQFNSGYLVGNTLTHAAGHLIHGSTGFIDCPVVNRGTINADTAGAALQLRGEVTNDVLLTATNDGRLELRNVVTQSDAGVIHAFTGNVLLAGASVTGGQLLTGGNVEIQTAVGTTSTLRDLRLAGNLRVVTASYGSSTLALGGSQVTNDGLITVQGGAGSGPAHLRIEQDGLELRGTGSVALIDDADIVPATGQTLVNGPGHAITGTGWIRTPLVNRGVLAPGFGPGTLRSSSSISCQPTSIFQVEIASPGGFDHLWVGGGISLDGILRIERLNGILPSRFDSFPILNAATRAGTFANATPFGLIPTVDAIGGFVPDYTAGGVVLRNFTRVGDVNLDNAVNNQDIADFVAVLTGITPPTGELGFAADCNRDGVVNNQDIASFVALLTGGRPLGELHADPDFAPLLGLVPEPGATVVPGVFAAALCRRRVR